MKNVYQQVTMLQYEGIKIRSRFRLYIYKMLYLAHVCIKV